MAEDLVKHLRNPNHAQAATLAESMMKQAADLIEQQAASLAAKDKEIERLANRLSFEQRAARVSRDRAEQAERALAEARTELGETQLVLEQTERNAARVIAEAITIIKFGLDVVSEERGWGTYQRMEGSEIYTDAVAFSEPARAFVAQHGSDSSKKVVP